jgi:leucyl-tRNA synthetase
MVFASPPADDVDWALVSPEGSAKFLARAWRLAGDVTSAVGTDASGGDRDLRAVTHRTLNEAYELLDNGKFNVVIARTMELVNATRKAIDGKVGGSDPAAREAAEAVALLLSLYAPYTAEDMWARLGHEPAIADVAWPNVDQALLVDESTTAVVQIKGKVRAKLQVPVDISEENLREAALGNEQVKRSLGDAEIVKVIVRAPKLVSIVIK